MSGKDVRKKIQALRRRHHNVKPAEIEDLAMDAGWVFDRRGKHAIYVREGFPWPLPIPQHKKLKGKLVLRLLNIIESSLYQEEEEE